MKIGNKTGYYWTISFHSTDSLYAVSDGMVDRGGEHLGEASAIVFYKTFAEAAAACEESHRALQAFLRDMKKAGT